MKIHIWKIRTEKNLTLRDLEKLSGVSRAHINAVENGKKSPTLHTLKLLAKALGVKVCDLFSEED